MFLDYLDNLLMIIKKKMLLENVKVSVSKTIIMAMDFKAINIDILK